MYRLGSPRALAQFAVATSVAQVHQGQRPQRAGSLLPAAGGEEGGTEDEKQEPAVQLQAPWGRWGPQPPAMGLLPRFIGQWWVWVFGLGRGQAEPEAVPRHSRCVQCGHRRGRLRKAGNPCPACLTWEMIAELGLGSPDSLCLLLPRLELERHLGRTSHREAEAYRETETPSFPICHFESSVASEAEPSEGLG